MVGQPQRWPLVALLVGWPVVALGTLAARLRPPQPALESIAVQRAKRNGTHEAWNATTR